MADPISRIRALNRSRKARKGIPPYYEVEDPATKAKYRVYGAKSQQEADQRVWNDVAMQRSKGGEQEIELPSELPAERQEFLDKADNPPKAEVLAFKSTRTVVGVGAAAGGVVEPGNIDLSNRPTVSNDDGSISTVSSMSFEEDGVEILVPTISDDGKRLTEEEAKALYKKTGKHLGKFKDADSATAFAKNLSKEQAQAYRPKKEPKKLEPGLYLDEETDKYFRVTESGDMVEVNLDAETP